jgi:chromosome partitioning protein
MYKTICLYNNKGGVSKTTTAFNLAAYLSNKKNKKTLIIDADPQCNITELFFASDERYQDDPTISLPGDSILDAFKSRLEGRASKIDVTELQFPESTVYKNLSILRGDINFSAMAEPYFSSSINQAITTNVNEKNTYVSFRRLIKDLISIRGFDHIIIDLGPSSGAISRLAFLSCDAFFVPIVPDRFCYLAVHTLPKILESWIEHDKLILSTLPPFGIEADFGTPTFLGGINQNFQMHKSKVKNSYQNWSKRIKTQLTKGLIESGMLSVDQKLVASKNPFICSIENIGSLAPVSQIVGKAIFDLSQDDTEYASASGTKFYGSVYEGWEKRIKSYEKEIAKLATTVVG